jgi:hypothetical protein
MVEIVGTATDKKFQQYTLKASPVGSESWSTIDTGGSPVEHGVLAQWDTAQLTPGSYRLRLEVLRTNGKDRPYDEITVEVQP